MKSNKDFQHAGGDESRKGPKLDPIRKSGKERHLMYKSLEDEEQEYLSLHKRESAYDYMDDDQVEE